MFTQHIGQSFFESNATDLLSGVLSRGHEEH